MKKLKFALLVVVLLAAIPTLFYAQIKHESTNRQDQKEEILNSKKDNAVSCGEISTLYLL